MRVKRKNNICRENQAETPAVDEPVAALDVSTSLGQRIPTDRGRRKPLDESNRVEPHRQTDLRLTNERRRENLVHPAARKLRAAHP